jgi:hypothetical protein
MTEEPNGNGFVKISNRDIYEMVSKLNDRMRALEIKVWGILVPASMIAVYLVKEMFLGR